MKRNDEPFIIAEVEGGERQRVALLGDDLLLLLLLFLMVDFQVSR